MVATRLLKPSIISSRLVRSIRHPDPQIFVAKRIEGTDKLVWVRSTALSST